MALPTYRRPRPLGRTASAPSLAGARGRPSRVKCRPPWVDYEALRNRCGGLELGRRGDRTLGECFASSRSTARRRAPWGPRLSTVTAVFWAAGAFAASFPLQPADVSLEDPVSICPRFFSKGMRSMRSTYSTSACMRRGCVFGTGATPKIESNSFRQRTFGLCPWYAAIAPSTDRCSASPGPSQTSPCRRIVSRPRRPKCEVPVDGRSAALAPGSSFGASLPSVKP